MRYVMDMPGVQEALHRQPFEPFSIKLTDGRSLPVPHPDFVALTNRRVIVVAEDGSWSIVEPLLIVSIDYASNAGRDRNGKRRKK
jgi:hypothetical protein